MLCSAGGVGRGVGTGAWAPRSATDFAAEVAVPGAAAADLARTGVSPRKSRAPTAAPEALPPPRCRGRQSRARVPLRTALPAPGCCHPRSFPPVAALRVALARPASPAKPARLPALPAPSAPAPGPRLPPGARLCARAAAAPGRSAAGRPAPAAPPAAPPSGAGPRATAVPVTARSRTEAKSITTFNSQRPSPSAGMRSAGRANSRASPANNCFTSRVLLPLACATSSCRCAASSDCTGRAAAVAAPEAPASGAVPVPPGSNSAAAGAAPGAAAAVAVRWRRSKVFCNCAAALRVSEPSCSRSRVPAVSEHRRMALIRRHAAPSL